MAVNTVNNQKTLQQIIDASSSKSNERNTGELGKNDFLNLLVTQLRYQDPLKPVEDKEFIAQMAQFSSLEQMQNINSSLSQSQAFSLIGKRVTGNIVDSTTKKTETIVGEVTNVKVDQGKTYVVVRGKDIPIDKIIDVTDALSSSNSNLSAYTNLIGTRASGAVYDPETGDIIKVNGAVKSIQKGVYEDYAMMDGVEVEISDIITQYPSTDPNFKKNYLESNIGKEVTVEIVDRATGNKVPVSAVLRDYTIDASGKVTAVLDGMSVPVESISDITKSPQASLSTYTSLIGYEVNGAVYDFKTSDTVGVSGIVKAIKSGNYENYAVMDNVNVKVAEVVTEPKLDGINATKTYLEERVNKEITVVINQPGSSDKVTVKAILGGYHVDETTGEVTATLNQLNVPVDSINSILPVEQE